MTGWSNTSVTARRSALAPSSTTSSGRVVSSPRSRKPASSLTHHRGVLGGALGQGERGYRRWSRVIPRATTQVCSATRMPSTSSATRSRPDRSAASSSARACSVAATNRRDTADLEVPELACSARLPTGSSPSCWRLAGSLASIRSTASWSSSSVGGERLPGGQSQLGGAVCAAHPRPVDPDPAAAEGDLGGAGCRDGPRPAAGCGGPWGRPAARHRCPTDSPAPQGRSQRPGRGGPHGRHRPARPAPP